MNEKIIISVITVFFISISLLLFHSNKYEYEEVFKPNFSFPFYKEALKEDYLKYQKNNNLTIKDSIIRVNIGLNHPFYENTSLALDINKITMLVNKYHYVNKDYIPDNLIEINGLLINKEVYESYLKMQEDMLKENLNIRIISAYRSYEYQESLYNNYLKYETRSLVDTYSARAGYSEHHTGLAIDIDNGKLDYNNFYLTKEFIWMNDNAYKYGFILRYPKDKEKITGYKYEPWHYRYVGKEIATYIKKNNSTYEEYYYEFLDK